MNRSFLWVKNQSVEVFPNPHKERTRALANAVFALHEKIRGAELNWDTVDGDRVALELTTVMLKDQIATLTGPDDAAWRSELRDIHASLERHSHAALSLLYSMAWEGGGPRPAGETFGWVDRMEDWVGTGP